MSCYNKTGTVRYNVTTDTHGYPWGFRNDVGGRVIHFDLGDNTISDTELGEVDGLETMSPVYFSIPGNHDKVITGYSAHQAVKIAEDSVNRIKFFGLDVCRSFTEFVVEIADIRTIAQELKKLEGDWDVMIFTHVPLFNGESPQGGCWEPGHVPLNTDELMRMLRAYNDHGSYQVNNTGISYGFTKSCGYVLGCFAGHVHNHIKGVFGGENDVGGFPMETMTSNGAEEWIKAGRKNNAAFYTPYEQYIEVNFSNGTVNGVSYKSPVYTTRYYDNFHIDTSCDKQQDSLGFLRFNSSSSLYPKFCKDGTYIGFSEQSAGTASKNDSNASWNLQSAPLYINGVSHTVSHIRFGASGLLRYYKEGSTFQEIPNYQTATVTFVPTASDTPVQWNFQGGKYVHDRAENYKFKSSSSYYPVFDSRGFYMGWSNAAHGYLTGIRDTTTSSRTFQLDATTVYQNGSVLASNAVEILFNPNGQLLSFKTSSGSYISVSTSTSATVTFTAGGRTWTFTNRKLVR